MKGEAMAAFRKWSEDLQPTALEVKARTRILTMHSWPIETRLEDAKVAVELLKKWIQIAEHDVKRQKYHAMGKALISDVTQALER